MTPAYGHVRDWIGRLPGPVAVAYEAGLGVRPVPGVDRGRGAVRGGGTLEVAAALGGSGKTDARDAVHLARLLRLDEVTAVAVPRVGQEAARDLVRAREDARRDLTRARRRFSGLLLRHGLVYYDGRRWTGRHDHWLRSLDFAQQGTRLAFADHYDTVLAAAARRARLDDEIEAMATKSEFTAVVRRLACLRGVGTLTGFALAVEIGDWDRFTGNSIGSFMGLVPSEHSSGEATTRGPITRAGNGHARRLLIEAAWHHRKPYRAGGTCGPAGTRPPPPPRPAATRATGGCTDAGPGSRPATRRPSSRTPPSPASWPAGAGPWPSWTNPPPTNRPPPTSSRLRLPAAPEPTHDRTMSNPPRATLDDRHVHQAPRERPVLR